MRKTSIILMAALMAGHGASGQEMQLVSGTMIIESGTSIHVEGPVTWTIAPGSAVVNNGIIDLGEEAVLLESLGEPITGDGSERARTAAVGVGVADEPGRLGLTVTPSSSIAPLELERWHNPLILPEGDQSIARWYRILTPTAPGTSLDLTLRYDPSELNGIDPDALGLFEAPDAFGPWTGLASLSDPLGSTVSATDQSPWALVTAFDANAPTSSSSLVSKGGFHVWPTLVVDQTTVMPFTTEVVTRLEVMDALGRTIEQPVTSATFGAVTIQLGHLAPGNYFLRVNATNVIKFRKV